MYCIGSEGLALCLIILFGSIDKVPFAGPVPLKNIKTACIYFYSSFMDHLASDIPNHILIARPKLYCIVPSTSSIQRLDFFAVAKGTTSWILVEGRLVPGSNSYLEDGEEITERRNIFVQKWLFFGLISEVFKGVDTLNLNNFISPNGGITTKPLIDLIDRWQTREHDTPIDRYQRLMYVRKVLDHAKSFACHFAVSSRGPSDINLDLKWPIADDLAFSILVLGQTLEHAWHQIMSELVKAEENQNHTYSGEYEEGWGSSRLVLWKLKSQKWDDLTIKFLQRFWKDNTIGLLMTLNFCKFQDYPSEVPDPYPYYHHVECEEECSPLGGNLLRDIHDALEAGSTPLFRYNPESQELEVERMDKTFNKSYMVFSHVWSDGFGNPKNNELNHCLLRHFDSRFRIIQKESAVLFGGRLSERPNLFWIDTLGIPVGADNQAQILRGRAIAQMHHVYKHAKYTIVLDDSLMSQDMIPEDYTRTATLITMSRWTRRLWTLPESVLSRDLYFNFSNGLYRVNMLEDLYKSAARRLHSSAPKLARMYHTLILEDERRLRVNMMQHIRHNDIYNLVSNLWAVIRWRDTAQRRHETLALSIILDFETEHLREAYAPGFTGTPEQRENLMKTLINTLAKEPRNALPIGMIFLPAPHLKTQGYRWAPLSWLIAQGVTYAEPISEKYPPTRLLNGDGLEVELSGFKLHGFELNCNKVQNTKSFNFAVSSIEHGWHHEWYRVGRADRGEWPKETDLQGGQAAIICSRTRVAREQQIGLLVSIKNHNRQNTITAHILCRIFISRELNTVKIDRLEQDLAGFKTMFYCYGEALPSTQRWHVDRAQLAPSVSLTLSEVINSLSIPGAWPIFPED